MYEVINQLCGLIWVMCMPLDPQQQIQTHMIRYPNTCVMISKFIIHQIFSLAHDWSKHVT